MDADEVEGGRSKSSGEGALGSFTELQSYYQFLDSPYQI